MFIIKPTATQSKKKNMPESEHDTFKGRLPDFLFCMPHWRVFNHGQESDFILFCFSIQRRTCCCCSPSGCFGRRKNSWFHFPLRLQVLQQRSPDHHTTDVSDCCSLYETLLVWCHLKRSRKFSYCLVSPQNIFQLGFIQVFVGRRPFVVSLTWFLSWFFRRRDAGSVFYDLAVWHKWV